MSILVTVVFLVRWQAFVKITARHEIKHARFQCTYVAWSSWRNAAALLSTVHWDCSLMPAPLEMTDTYQLMFPDTSSVVSWSHQVSFSIIIPPPDNPAEAVRTSACVQKASSVRAPLFSFLEPQSSRGSPSHIYGVPTPLHLSSSTPTMLLQEPEAHAFNRDQEFPLPLTAFTNLPFVLGEFPHLVQATFPGDCLEDSTTGTTPSLRELHLLSQILCHSASSHCSHQLTLVQPYVCLPNGFHCFPLSPSPHFDCSFGHHRLFVPRHLPNSCDLKFVFLGSCSLLLYIVK